MRTVAPTQLEATPVSAALVSEDASTSPGPARLTAQSTLGGGSGFLPVASSLIA